MPMMKRIAAFLSLLMLLASHGHSQLSEKANLFGGITYQFVGFTPLTSPQQTLFPLYGLGLGVDYVLAHSNDVASLGINPNAHLCVQFNYNNLSLLASAPTYLLARIGAGATPFNEQKLGIGAGVGGSASYFATTDGGGTISSLFFNPSACAELSIRTRGSSYLFRFNWSLMKPTREITYSNLTASYRVGVFGLGVLYSL
ncbi:MAG: hypothetical protein RLZZ165_802 [Bacteroidota bacterium]